MLKTLHINEKEIHLLGTAHVSARSVEDVRQLVGDLSPDVLCVELDTLRKQTLLEGDAHWQRLDLVEILRKGQFFLLVVQLILAQFQKRLARQQGIVAGAEMKEALILAQEKGIALFCVDRDAAITLKRAWGMSSFWQRLRLLSEIAASAFSEQEISPEEIENLKERDILSAVMEDFSRHFPRIRQVLIDERDAYLAYEIYQKSLSGSKTLAVLGAGHLPGVEKYLHALVEEKQTIDLTELCRVPQAWPFWRLFPWLVTILIGGILLTPFLTGQWQKGFEALSLWFWANSIPTALGALLVLAHPLTILTAFVGAPFTSMTPLIGIGFLATLVEIYFRRPKVEDLIHASEDLFSWKRVFKNRLTRALLVFFLTSLGSFFGTFWGLRLVVLLGLV